MKASNFIMALLAVLFAVFIWPTLYHRDKVISGSKIYPLRTNRISEHVQYYDGKKWRDPPIPIDDSKVKSDVSTTKMPESVTTTSVAPQFPEYEKWKVEHIESDRIAAQQAARQSLINEVHQRKLNYYECWGKGVLSYALDESRCGIDACKKLGDALCEYTFYRLAGQALEEMGRREEAQEYFRLSAEVLDSPKRKE